MELSQQVIDIIWFVVWGAVILISAGLVIWAIVALFVLRNFRKVSRSIDRDFGRNNVAERLARRSRRF